jgi:Putative porin
MRMLLIGLFASVSSIAQAAEDNTFAGWVPFGDARLRYENTRDIPARSDDISRERLRLRGGLQRSFASGWEIAAAAKLNLGSDGNDQVRRNLDNERADKVSLDQLYALYGVNENVRFEIGKSVLPLSLSPLTWDQDLRPIGASVDAKFPVHDFDAFHFTAGYFKADHLFDEKTKLAAVQLGYGWQEGAANSLTGLISYMRFSDQNSLIPQSLGRTNRRAGPAFISDFELLDFQLIGQTEIAGWPLALRLDGVKNMGAKDQNKGGRISLVGGNSRQANGLEVGFAFERLQRDAVLAAFNEDDWWFHSFSRGGMPWVRYGLDDTWRLGLIGFYERRDGVKDFTKRVLFDVEAVF